MFYAIKQNTIFHYAKCFTSTIFFAHQKNSLVSPRLSVGKSVKNLFVKNIKRLACFIVFR